MLRISRFRPDTANLYNFIDTVIYLKKSLFILPHIDLPCNSDATLTVRVAAKTVTGVRDNSSDG